MATKIQVKKVGPGPDMDAVFEIRRKVFVDEQNCPAELEWEFEEESVHFLGTSDGHPAGAARWRRTAQGIKLERFAVAKEYRNQGMGQALVAAVLADIPEDSDYVYLHAQTAATGLYSKFGFEKLGSEFEEAGIRHFKMVLKR